MMKKALIGVAMLTAAAAAVPASAQYYGGDGYRGGGDIRGQIQRLDYRVERAAERGTISRREAYRLGQEVDRLQWQAQRFGRDGFNRWEREELNRRIYNVSAQLREDRRDGRWNDRDGRWNDGRYDRDDRYDRYERRDERRWDRDD